MVTDPYRHGHAETEWNHKGEGGQIQGHLVSRHNYRPQTGQKQGDHGKQTDFKENGDTDGNANTQNVFNGLETRFQHLSPDIVTGGNTVLAGVAGQGDGHAGKDNAAANAAAHTTQRRQPKQTIDKRSEEHTSELQSRENLV